MKKILMLFVGTGTGSLEGAVGRFKKDKDTSREHFENLIRLNMAEPVDPSAVSYLAGYYEQLLHAEHPDFEAHQLMLEYGFSHQYEPFMFPYQKAKYSINGKEPVETYYVAKPISEEFRPDITLLVGTVRSRWEGFYTCFTENPRLEDALKLSEMEQTADIHTEGKDLEKFRAETERIYQQVSEHKESHLGKVIPVLTRYGTDQKQLQENYTILSNAIRSVLEEGTSYEVAFDITHALRAIPLYDFILLNYNRMVTDFDVHIAHIYYGNLDARWENKNHIAPIVDLKNLQDVLEITSGIREFRNSGTTTILQVHLKNSDPEMERCLADFELAVQSDNLYQIVGKLVRLDQMAQRGTARHDAYTDLYAGIHREIENSILENVSIADAERFDNDRKCNAEVQLALTNWFLKCGKYGMAAMVSYEAMQSMVVDLYRDYQKETLGKTNISDNYWKDEAMRGSAVLKLKTISADNPADTYAQFLHDLGGRSETLKRTRNIFAHNLTGLTDKNGKAVTENHSESADKKIITDYVERLNRLQEMKKDPHEREQLKRCFCGVLDRKPANAVLLVGSIGKYSENAALRKKLLARYAQRPVYILPPSGIWSMPSIQAGMTTSFSYQFTSKVCFAAENIAEYAQIYFEPGTEIVLCMNRIFRMIYAGAFKKKGFSKIMYSDDRGLTSRRVDFVLPVSATSPEEADEDLTKMFNEKLRRVTDEVCCGKRGNGR